MSIGKSVLKGILDTIRWVANIVFGASIAYFLYLAIQGEVAIQIYQVWLIIVLVIMFPFNIIMTITYDKFGLSN